MNYYAENPKITLRVSIGDAMFLHLAWIFRKIFPDFCILRCFSPIFY